ncbi:C40 family peptidase [Aeromonas jandaei]|uniref:C40 family peptidase n=1 Tax=Aeromonas jandaei TaxID=650 RepID=UPI000D338419|nr:NlpC/P60 family protein [Aeromonas jandaei]
MPSSSERKPIRWGSFYHGRGAVVISCGDLIGVPFRYGGRDPGEALDCYGLLMELYRRAYQIELPDYTSPTSAAEISALMRGQLHLWQPVDDVEPGVVLFMRLGRFTHVAMYLGDDEFIHTSEITGGVCRERLSNWINRIEGLYRYAAQYSTDHSVCDHQEPARP